MLIYHKINKELPLDIATYNAIYAQAIRTATNIANSFWLKYNANLIASNADVIYIFEKYIHSIKPPNLNNLYTLSFKLDSIIKLALQTTVMQNVVRNNSSRFIYKILTEYMECNVHLIDKEPSKKLKHVSDAVKSGRELRRKQYINNVMSARTIDLQEYKELEARHKLQQEDYWAVRRYRFESELCINVADITNSKQIHELC